MRGLRMVDRMAVTDDKSKGSDMTAGFAELRGYWEALRHDGQLPRRSDLDPRGIASTLNRVMMAEKIAPGLARLRLAGSAYADVLGMEVRGMPLSCLFDPMARKALEIAVAEVYTGKTAVTLLLEADRGLGRPALSGQLLMLPLRDDDGQVDLMICCLALRGAAGRTPRRFQILHVKREPLDGSAVPQPKLVMPHEKALAPTKRESAFAEPKEVYVPARRPASERVPYLRVVK
jgi:hypothetical protein